MLQVAYFIIMWHHFLQTRNLLFAALLCLWADFLTVTWVKGGDADIKINSVALAIHSLAVNLHYISMQTANIMLSYYKHGGNHLTATRHLMLRRSMYIYNIISHLGIRGTLCASNGAGDRCGSFPHGSIIECPIAPGVTESERARARVCVIGGK